MSAASVENASSGKPRNAQRQQKMQNAFCIQKIFKLFFANHIRCKKLGRVWAIIRTRKPTTVYSKSISLLITVVTIAFSRAREERFKDAVFQNFHLQTITFKHGSNLTFLINLIPAFRARILFFREHMFYFCFVATLLHAAEICLFWAVISQNVN